MSTALDDGQRARLPELGTDLVLFLLTTSAALAAIDGLS